MDLFIDDFTRLTGADLYSEITTLLQLSGPQDQRPQEGARLDFKAKWNNSALKTLAAFANTLGGLLIVGIEESGGYPVAMPGVISGVEEKTRIASSISANISPTPSFDIAVCTLPHESDKQVCIVRVRPTRALYLLSVGENPIYVRNGPESRPANAAQVRYLIERGRDSNAIDGRLQRTTDLLQRELAITVNANISAHPHQRHSSPTSLILLLFPLDQSNVIKIPLDISLEKNLRNSIHAKYKRVAYCLAGGVGSETEVRGREFFAYRWIHRELDYEMAWAFTTTGDVGFSSQVKTRVPVPTSSNSWSLGDLVGNLLLILDLAATFWRAVGYWGDARILANLKVDELPMWVEIPTIGDHDRHEVRCHILDTKTTLPLGSATLTQSPRPTAHATADFCVSNIDFCKIEVAANMLNQVLRSMGHSASLSDLRDGVRHLNDALEARS